MRLEVDSQFHGVGTSEVVEYAIEVFIVPGSASGAVRPCIYNVVVVEEVVDVARKSGLNAADIETVRSVYVELVAPGNTPGFSYIYNCVGAGSAYRVV